MDFNKNLFVSTMKARGDTQKDVAEILSISPSRLSAKLNNKDGADFTRKEIARFVNHYKLSSDETISIFFSHPVS